MSSRIPGRVFLRYGAGTTGVSFTIVVPLASCPYASLKN